MPTYVYACRECGARKEVMQRISDEPLKTCEQCSGEVYRVMFPVGVVYKGSGFYVTDYARKGNGGGSSDESTSTTASTGTAAESKPETKSETKTETKTEAKAETPSAS